MMNRLILFLMAVLLLPLYGFAQKRNVEATKTEYAKFQLAFSIKNVENQLDALNKAKITIDEAILHKKTINDPEAWVYRSLIYSLLCLVDKESPNLESYFDDAQKAYDKAIELNTENKFEETLNAANQNMASFLNSKALKCYEEKDYNCAFDFFKKTIKRLPGDTILHYYSGVVGNLSEKYNEAIEYFKKAEELGLRSAQFYAEYKKPYLALKDTTTALNILERGRKNNPDDNNLLFDEINIYIKMEKIDVLLSKLQEAINKDPDNKTIHYVRGYAFEIVKKHDKAFESYKKAVELDPTYYNAQLAAGQILVQKANLIINEANELPLEETEKFNELEANFKVALKKSLPYLLKARELDEKKAGITKTLMEIYTKLGMTEEAQKLKDEN